MTCRSCRRDVPDAMFCTACGADQRSADASLGRTARRLDRFAAHPDEPVVRFGMLTTLLPHLDRDRVEEFRWVLFAGLGVILLLYLAGLVTAAILAAAFLVPLVYVLYLYEVRTYRDAPASVFGLTMGGGIMIGALATFGANLVRGPAAPPIQGSPFGIDIDPLRLVLVGVAIPAVLELVKPIPALLLRRRPQFAFELDGLVFGVAAGLGFALAETIVQFGPLFAALDVRTDPGEWIFPLATIGIMSPVLHGSTTGIVAGVLWRSGRPRRHGLALAGLVAAIASHVAFVIGSQYAVAAGLGWPVVLIWQGGVTAGMLLVLRYFLHRALLAEARAFGFDRLECPYCGETVTASDFCPACGMALAASTVPVHPPSGMREPAA